MLKDVEKARKNHFKWLALPFLTGFLWLWSYSFPMEGMSAPSRLFAEPHVKHFSGQPETQDQQARPAADAAFMKQLAVGLGANGALEKLDISNNNIPSDQQAELKRICTSKIIKLTL